MASTSQCRLVLGVTVPSTCSKAMPPDDGGGIVKTVRPAYVPRRGVRGFTWYAAKSAMVNTPPRATTVSTMSWATHPERKASPPVSTHARSASASAGRRFPVRKIDFISGAASSERRRCSPISKPSVASRIAGAATVDNGARPYRRCNSANPIPSLGTATARPPSVDVPGSA